MIIKTNRGEWNSHLNPHGLEITRRICQFRAASPDKTWPSVRILSNLSLLKHGACSQESVAILLLGKHNYKGIVCVRGGANKVSLYLFQGDLKVILVK